MSEPRNCQAVTDNGDSFDTTTLPVPSITGPLVNYIGITRVSSSRWLPSFNCDQNYRYLQHQLTANASGQAKFLRDLEGMLALAAQVPSTNVILTFTPSSGRRLSQSAGAEVSAVVWFGAKYNDAPSEILGKSAFKLFDLRLRKAPEAIFGTSTSSYFDAKTVQQHLGLIGDTLLRAMPLLFHIFLLFLIVLLMFAVAVYIMLGWRRVEVATYKDALQDTFLSLVDYSRMQDTTNAFLADSHSFKTLQDTDDDDTPHGLIVLPIEHFVVGLMSIFSFFFVQNVLLIFLLAHLLNVFSCLKSDLAKG
eukprot:gene27892-12011_t